MTYAEKIKAECSKKGITVKQLESDLGFSNGWVNKQINSVKNEKLVKIANYLEVPVEVFYNESEKLEVSRTVDAYAAYLTGMSPDEYLLIETYRTVSPERRIEVLKRMVQAIKGMKEGDPNETT